MRFDPLKEIKSTFDPKGTIAVDVYLEARRTRTYVGRLRRGSRVRARRSEKEQRSDLGFSFSYDERYLYSDSALPLGPDLPLTRREHFSDELFPAFSDRIPSAKNPAYKEYCAKVGISSKESDPIILLPTIAKRGPSAFVFESVWPVSFGAQEVAAYRKQLGLTYREFAALFELSPASVQRIESGKAAGRDVLKRLEIYKRFPETVLFELERNGAILHSDVKERLLKHLQSEIGET